jgi:hypothetical protein
MLKLPASKALLMPKKSVVFGCLNSKHIAVAAAHSCWEWLLEWILWDVLPCKIEYEVPEIG